MTNFLYPKAKEAFLSADLDLLVDTIKVRLLNISTYTISESDEFMSTVMAGATAVDVDITLTGKTVTNGQFKADNAAWATVTGAAVEAFVVFKSTGVNSTSRLITFSDQAFGIPHTPDGGPLTIVWDRNTRIFSL